MKQEALSGRGGRLPRKLAEARWPWILLLLALSAVYYGSFVRYGIGFRDEGQTVALGAQRLLHGEVPFRDVVLNYNVLWFYPVVALFKFCGVNYVLLRGYCFALSCVTVVFTFLIVEKGIRRPWLAFLISLVPLLIPGSPFKNYIPLIAVTNTWCLLQVALCAASWRERWWRVAASGLVLGLSFLVRIDIALLFGALWIGLLASRVLLPEGQLPARVGAAIRDLLLLAAVTALVHWPAWHDAERRGFSREFAEQYLEKGRMLTGPIEHLLLLAAPRRPALETAAVPEVVPPPLPATTAAPVSDSRKTLARASFNEISKVGENAGAAFILLAYAPVVGAIILGLWALMTLCRAWHSREVEGQRRGIAALVAIGGALTTFPQFFFFRPDVPHLSEFMPGYIAAAGAALGLLWLPIGTQRAWRLVAVCFFSVQLCLYLAKVLPDRWAGTSAARAKRNKFFTAENGVRVYVSSRDLIGLTAIRNLISTYAPSDKDYVVCYPYSPGINLLANRSTYEKNVYVDNAMHPRRWDEEAIARFERFRPAVIVLSDWDINGTPASRFSVWAVRTKTWIQTKYTFQGAYSVGSDSFEIYTR